MNGWETGILYQRLWNLDFKFSRCQNFSHSMNGDKLEWSNWQNLNMSFHNFTWTQTQQLHLCVNQICLALQTKLKTSICDEIWLMTLHYGSGYSFPFKTILYSAKVLLYLPQKYQHPLANFYLFIYFSSGILLNYPGWFFSQTSATSKFTK